MRELNSIDESCLNTVEELDLQQAMELAIFLQQKNRNAEAEDIFCRILAVAPNHADALHYYGIVKHFQGDSEQAIELIERALSIVPDYVQAYNNLGNIHSQNRQFEKAVAAYRKVIDINPDFKTAYNNLGVALKESGKIVEAVDVLLKAIQIDPYLQMFYQNLGNVFRQQGELEDAMDQYLDALAQRPFNPDTYRHLSASLKLCGQDERAVEILRKLLDIDPDNSLAQHTLSAYTGENIPIRADDDYVRETFDRFALSFDTVLKNLDYKAPFLIEQAFREIVCSEQDSLHVLDAGCGTGLCGPLLRPWVGHLTGVDLSGQMLGRAKQRQVYDELVEEELTSFLNRADSVYDVIVSADVLCYFGELSAVLDLSAKALKPGGYLIFTVEKLNAESDAGFRLNSHGRYSHSQVYVGHCVAAAGLLAIGQDSVVLRMESGDPVGGFIVTAQKPS